MFFKGLIHIYLDEAEFITTADEMMKYFMYMSTFRTTADEMMKYFMYMSTYKEGICL